MSQVMELPVISQLASIRYRLEHARQKALRAFNSKDRDAALQELNQLLDYCDNIQAWIRERQ